MLTSVKLVLLDQLAACHNDESWFKSSTKILSDISIDEAAWKAEDNSQSIWEITNHLIFWNEMWLNRFVKDVPFEESDIANIETFDTRQYQDEEHWKASILKLSDGFESWREAITSCEDEKLEKRLPFYFEAPWWGVISNLCIHNAYHIGQIMLLKKQIQTKSKGLSC
ncbi:DinB family protein [Paenibacillus qinlingensis]|uniref:Damage-inducible protein DinB n=1 Tax=Paenibacillus qinlingensis TaxID=1837343 RepID=A0ABU1NR88_9BACL|nr:DinB family protein [Paenibacillus qinlingensis]MDR6549991.1 putative damage-inducible protein DinB [Paenibacillus qinlingensis]